jgi:hypothetical protein
MSWTNVGYILFQAGALLATGIVTYGGWLYIAAVEVKSHNATDDGQPSGATSEAKSFPTLLQY